MNTPLCEKLKQVKLVGNDLMWCYCPLLDAVTFTDEFLNTYKWFVECELGGERRDKNIKTGGHQINNNKILLTLVPNVGFAYFSIFTLFSSYFISAINAQISCRPLDANSVTLYSRKMLILCANPEHKSIPNKNVYSVEYK